MCYSVVVGAVSKWLVSWHPRRCPSYVCWWVDRWQKCTTDTCTRTVFALFDT